MKRSGICLGLLLLTAALAGCESHNHTHDHSHSTIDVSTYSAIPEISVEAMRDAAAGWNIRLTTQNFRFAPEKVNTEAVEGEGHAHLFVDNKKIARLYGPWFHLDKLSPGRHTIHVSLNANDHSDLALGDQPIVASIEVEQ